MPDDAHDSPTPHRDPRLEIPKALRTPVEKPASLIREEQEAATRQQQAGNLSGMAKAFAMATDFIVSILAGAALGYGVDYFAGSLPWGTVVGLFAGFILATTRLIRMTNREEEAAKKAKNP